ncbi:InlB B-repeat-containing protein [Nocardioides sp. LMS-CY]|uniref:InlB B-repeat-containing protein n=1 Tax=Nocardioides sp. (strain LMS-CY) TaxID=2840457 RepID=UPI001C000D17|nr:InlB B-repeat-containing protein [Nocardioides sp. LMS-CY]QWF21655.1 InlB B-repeat-containing protein [Nocardioides sp. LMS-CY]
MTALPPPGTPRRPRTVVSAGLATAVVVSGLTLGAGLHAPALAAPGDDLGDLATLLNSCNGNATTPTVVALTDSLTDPAATLTVACDARIDLAGHDLTVRNIVIDSGESLDVTDTSIAGTPGHLIVDASAATYTAGIQNTGATLTTHGRARLTATGGDGGAGIGGGYMADGGTTTSNDTSTITAIGGENSAGIGGGDDGGAGGTTTANDASTITATGGPNAAGIGGGDDGHAGVTIATGTSTITATGGPDGAGIGGGDLGDGGLTVAKDNSTVTATGGPNGAGIGGGNVGAGGVTTLTGGTVTAVPGAGAEPVGPGKGAALHLKLTVSGGVLRLPSGTQTVPAASTTASPLFEIGPNGLVTGGPATAATITGTGILVNHGTLTVPTANVQTQVSDRHYRITFDLNGGTGTTPDPVTVYADTPTRGDRTLPTAPTRAGHTFVGWNTAADGTGIPVTATTTLPGTSTDGTPVPIVAHARWTPDPVGPVTDLPRLPDVDTLVTPAERPRIGTAVRVVATPPDIPGATSTYQWQRTSRKIGKAWKHLPRSWVDISTATRARYTPRPGDRLHRIRLVITTTAPGHQPGTTVTRLPRRVLKGHLPRPDSRLTIRGSRGVGDTVRLAGLSRYRNQLIARAKVTITWYADGTRLRNATRRTYTVRPAAVGKRLHATLTITAPGHHDRHLTTPRTGR